MSSVDKCYQAYKTCLGTKPTQERQIECTFKYAQCVLGMAQAMVAKQLKGSESAGGKKSTSSGKRR